MARAILAVWVLLLGSRALVAQDEQTEWVAFRLETVDDRGLPISQVQIGELVRLQAWVTDLRPDSIGVYSGYLDVGFDSELVLPDLNSLRHGEAFGMAPSGGRQVAELDEVGSLSAAFEPIGPGEFLLWSVDFRATATGLATFAADPADVLPRHETTLYGHNDAIPSTRALYGSAAVRIVPEPASALVGSGAAAIAICLLCRSKYKHLAS